MGVPIGPKSFVTSYWMEKVQGGTSPLVEALKDMEHLQSHFKLLEFCAGPKAQFMLRLANPNHTGDAARLHDKLMAEALEELLQQTLSRRMEEVLVLPQRMGGGGFPRATDMATPAYLASSAAAYSTLKTNQHVGKLISAVENVETSSVEADRPRCAEKKDQGIGANRVMFYAHLETLFQNFLADKHRRLQQIEEGEKAKGASKSTGRSGSEASCSEGGKCKAENPQVPMVKKLVLNKHVLESLPVDMPHLLTMAATPKFKLQRLLSEAVHRCNFSQMYRKSTMSMRAKIISQSQMGASAWMSAIASDVSLSLMDHEFRYTLGLWLCSQQSVDEERGLPCFCTKWGAVVVAEDHYLNCKFGGGIIARHDKLAVQVTKMMRTTYGSSSVVYEPRAIFPGFGKGGPDIKVDGFKGFCKSALFDVAFVNESQGALVRKASIHPLSAAASTEAMKHTKYDLLARAINMKLFPVVVETSGAFGKSALEVLQACSTEFARRGLQLHSSTTWASNTFIKYWMQRMSVAHRRGACAMSATLARIGATEYYRRQQYFGVARGAGERV